MPVRVSRWRWAALLCVATLLSLFVLRTYVNVYDTRDGWTKLIWFGSDHAAASLPRLQQTPHYVNPAPWARYGYDGQYYAQLAIDPSLRDPALAHALDGPVYRARRIGLPLLASCLGGGQPGRALQAYALGNLLCWFLLLGVLAVLFRPWTGQQLLCLSTAVVSYGIIVSMDRALTDLPAAALIFLGVMAGRWQWGRSSALAAAVLTRETSLLAVGGFVEWGLAWRSRHWQRDVALLAVVTVPFALWLVYVNARFAHVQSAPMDTGATGNFSLPLLAAVERFTQAARDYAARSHHPAVWRLRWLWYEPLAHEMLIIVSLGFQGLYLLLRRETSSPFWKMGVCYLALGAVLGPAVWEGAGAAARTLLPMTLCFYLLLARERAAWFWPFFVLGSLSIPYGLHEFWMFG